MSDAQVVPDPQLMVTIVREKLLEQMRDAATQTAETAPTAAAALTASPTAAPTSSSPSTSGAGECGSAPLRREGVSEKDIASLPQALLSSHNMSPSSTMERDLHTLGAPVAA